MASAGETIRSERLGSVDIARGLVMVVMALDHTRDVFTNATFDPTDLDHTNVALFLTRWITHFCAPVFVLLAGTGAFLGGRSGRSRPDLARFLATRGLWLIFLEVAVISPLGWSFSLGFAFTRLQVIWAIGASMVVLAGLVLTLPRRAILAVGLLIVLGHNLFDGARAAWLGAALPGWRLLNEITPIPLAPHKLVLSLYPLLPWFGIMAVGYGAGDLVTLSEPRRSRVLLTFGLSCIALFFVLRFANGYGDPHPWSVQARAGMTPLSLFNVSKYPPSLLYTLMTLGPALCFLAVADRLPAWIKTPFATLGRVPLFYYLLHLPLIHALAVVFSQVRYGGSAWLFQDMMAAKHSAYPLPAGYGYDLWVVYAVWIGVVIALYPLCAWFASVKSRRVHPLLSYL